MRERIKGLSSPKQKYARTAHNSPQPSLTFQPEADPPSVEREGTDEPLMAPIGKSEERLIITNPMETYLESSDASVGQTITKNAETGETLRAQLQELAGKVYQKMGSMRDQEAVRSERPMAIMLKQIEDLHKAMTDQLPQIDTIGVEVQNELISIFNKEDLRLNLEKALDNTNDKSWSDPLGIPSVGSAIASSYGKISPEAMDFLQNTFMKPVNVSFGDSPLPAIGQSFGEFVNINYADKSQVSKIYETHSEFSEDTADGAEGEAARLAADMADERLEGQTVKRVIPPVYSGVQLRFRGQIDLYEDKKVEAKG